jgi:hypothetical protein
MTGLQQGIGLFSFPESPQELRAVGFFLAMTSFTCYSQVAFEIQYFV